MRLATLRQEGREFVAIEREGEFFSWKDLFPQVAAHSVRELLAGGRLDGLSLPRTMPQPVRGDVEILAPIPEPVRNIICLGKNYAAHAREFDRSIGASTLDNSPASVFTKATTTVAGPYADVVVSPSISQEFDYEVELALVIGRGGKNIPEERAYEHIAGYTVLNDVTARDVQHRHNQWFLGKSIDGTAPMGPVLVTADEVPDPENLEISATVDGEPRQASNTGLMLTNIRQTIALVSSVMTLVPGDIIATGTPEGVGIGFTPPKYLQDGQVVRCTIAGIGSIENRFRFAESNVPLEPRIGSEQAV